MTNGDKIRSMTDEQLAGHMTDAVLTYMASIVNAAVNDAKTWENTRAGFLEILQQEAQDLESEADD